ncbi:MAG: hypothetical protein ACLFTK_05960 [Anaerolineales bacterium]
MYLRIPFLLSIILLSLAACSPGLDADNAEIAVRAAFEGDTDTANDYICPEEHLEDEDVAALANLTVEDVACDDPEDNTIQCELSLTVPNTGTTYTQEATFGISDGHLCQSAGASLEPALVDAMLPDEDNLNNLDTTESSITGEAIPAPDIDDDPEPNRNFNELEDN